MSELRLWIHHKIARLDGVRERRFVALATALIFASLSLGPQALRIVDAAVNTPDIRIDELGANPVSNPVRFHATTLNVLLSQVFFLVTMPDGSIMTIPGHHASTVDPSLWESDDFNGTPGQTYVVKGRGVASATAPPVESQQPVTFSIFDPTTGTQNAPPPVEDPANTPTSGFVEIFQLVAWPGTVPKIEVRGQYSGFASDSAFFRVQSISGLAFLSDIEAERGDGTVWRAFFPVPGGSIYKVTLVARATDGNHESLPLSVAVPVAETSTSTQTATTTSPTTTTPPPPPPPPSVSLLLPSAGAELMSPVQFTSRVLNATATSLVYEVIDPSGVTRTIQAAPGSAGEWTAMFTGAAGQYGVGVRAFLIGGTVIPPASLRSFKILAAATTTSPTAEAPVAVAEPTAATSTPVAEPFIELFSPAADAPPFPGAVPISARVRNGLPEKVVAIVLGPNGGETVVIASKTATGDFWTALSEGPDGEYHFRVRALVGGKDVFSPERRFSVKRPITTTPPPPPPTTTTTTTQTTTALPPPPPTGTVPPPPAATTGAATSQAPVVGTAPLPAALPDELAFECRQAGILPERCADWLKAKYQSRECLDAGATTREACAALLGRMHIAPDESKLVGLASREDLMQARDDARALAGAPVRRDRLPPSIAALVPEGKDPAAFVRVFGVANPKEDSSPALLIIDTDGDGLPDDIERRFGTDPDAPDTDGDGFSDGMETKNGYNPLGSGTLEKPVRGVEKALIEGLSLEEPRGSETPVDDTFTITAEAGAPEDETGEDVIRLAGTAAPNSVVTIFVYSYLPIVVTTTTDANGNWTYDFGSKLAEGRHEAYVSVNDDTGKLVAASSPLAFFVKEAQAVSEEDFLRPDVNVEETPATLSRWFVYGGIGLVALALVLVIAIIRQVRKSPTTGSGESL